MPYCDILADEKRAHERCLIQCRQDHSFHPNSHTRSIPSISPARVIPGHCGGGCGCRCRCLLRATPVALIDFFEAAMMGGSVFRQNGEPKLVLFLKRTAVGCETKSRNRCHQPQKCRYYNIRCEKKTRTKIFIPDQKGHMSHLTILSDPPPPARAHSRAAANPAAAAAAAGIRYIGRRNLDNSLCTASLCQPTKSQVKINCPASVIAGRALPQLTRTGRRPPAIPCFARVGHRECVDLTADLDAKNSFDV